MVSDPSTREEYIKAAKKMMNMTPRSARSWQETEAYNEYRRYRDGQRYSGYTDGVVDRAIRVYNGVASKQEAEKVYSYLSRTEGAEAGDRRFGSGRSKVSAETAAQRNWLRDPTGRFS